MTRIKLPKGSWLYSILFSGTAVIIAVMLIVDYNLQIETRKAHITLPADNLYSENGDDINKLLLSGNELTIEEKTSLINLYLKTGEPVAVLKNNTIKQKREELYNAILKRQINKFKKSGSNDFSIRPVPR
jgi:hypothetical protein